MAAFATDHRGERYCEDRRSGLRAAHVGSGRRPRTSPEAAQPGRTGSDAGRLRPGKIATWNVCLELADTSCGPATRWPWVRGIAIAWAWTPMRTACGVRKPG